jgi:hypothetical protein
MPYSDPDPTDPQELIGVLLPGDESSVREMAYTFAEEFARLGHGRDGILALFRSPHYGGAHGAWRALGPERVEAIVDECVAVWGRRR